MKSLLSLGGRGLRSWAAALAWTTLVLPASALAIDSKCRDDIRPVDDNPLGYRLRGNRCEGLYWSPHASDAAITVLAVATGAPAAALPGEGVLHLGWSGRVSGAIGDAVQIQAISLRPGLFYRMDATASLGGGRFDWPTDVVRGLSLRGDEIALRVQARARIGQVTWPILLPLSLSGGATEGAGVRVLVTSTVALFAISWECLRIESSGMPAQSVARGRAGGPFRADEVVTLEVAAPGSREPCYLDIVGEPVVASNMTPPSAHVVVQMPSNPVREPRAASRAR
ncbi:hypothetical protein [Scleromatobacter humisilvae]|uniref:Uncharacterized protein n=1 Tax=Scleromatobacter humisilvae TaxID=2897159 RepID=A0A9X1YF96_9BURK|nr:hypothetical protein [Scleromatobacter humisilvae]MCK9684582.1 hypothetical protein [Scleromatobacter humisilvae]